MRYTFSTNYTFLTKTQAVRFKYSADLSCPLCPHMDNALHMLSGCQHSTIRNMITERHKLANRKTITALTKSVHGANLFILALKVLLNFIINAWATWLLLTNASSLSATWLVRPSYRNLLQTRRYTHFT